LAGHSVFKYLELLSVIFLSDIVGLIHFEGGIVTLELLYCGLGSIIFTSFNEVILSGWPLFSPNHLELTFGDFLTKPRGKGGLDLGTFKFPLLWPS